MDEHSHDEASGEPIFCKKCSYCLTGLTRYRCPECGRKFDPTDLRSMDTTRSQLTRRRWKKRLLIFSMLIAVAIVICPRGIKTGSVEYRCLACDEVITVVRNQLREPWWIPLQYPGWHRLSVKESTGYHGVRPSPVCAEHAPHVRIVLETHDGSNFQTFTDRGLDEYLFINGKSFAPHEAGQRLKELMAPSGLQTPPQFAHLPY